jgi:hypothetical protein
MGGKEWGISLALGFVSLPLGAVIRLIPNEPCERIFRMLRLLPKPEARPTLIPDAEPGFAFAVDQVRDNLGTFAKLRGGRMRGSSFVHKSRSAGPDLEAPHLVYVPLDQIILRIVIIDCLLFSGLDYWRWSLRWWPPILSLPTGSTVPQARSQIQRDSIHRNHLLRFGKISSKYTPRRIATTLCSGYSAQRRGHSPHGNICLANTLRPRNGLSLTLPCAVPTVFSFSSAGGAISSVCTTAPRTCRFHLYFS